jgi:hypothetical protein
MRGVIKNKCAGQNNYKMEQAREVLGKRLPQRFYSLEKSCKEDNWLKPAGRAGQTTLNTTTLSGPSYNRGAHFRRHTCQGCKKLAGKIIGGECVW